MRWVIPEPAAVFEVAAPDGAATVVRRHGNPDGPRLVLSHGSAFAIDAYFPFWSRFTARFDVFVYDLRNHGWNAAGDLNRHTVPNMVEDGELVVREIDRRFGAKPRAGIFHSLSTLIALRQEAMGGGGFCALMLFDPPVYPPGGFPEDLEGIGQKLRRVAMARPDRFESPEVLAEQFSRSAVYGRVAPEALDLLARATLRRAADGTGYELCCPRDFQAQVAEFIFIWAMTVDFANIACPVKAIGGDPTVKSSYLPSMNLSELVRLDYDFVPEASHLLQIEEPGTCADLVLEFLKAHGLA